MSEGFSFSRLTAGEKLRHRWTCVPAVYLRLFALLRRSGAHPAARIPMLRTDFGLPRSQPEKITDHLRNNRPILRWDQRSFRWFMLDRVKFCTLETFGDSVATASFLRCTFRSFSPRFSSVMRLLSPVFFGDYLRCHKPSFYVAMKSFIVRQNVRL